MQNRLSENGFIVKELSHLSSNGDSDSRKRNEESHRLLPIVPDVALLVQAHAEPIIDTRNIPENESSTKTSCEEKETDSRASPKIKIARGDSYDEEKDASEKDGMGLEMIMNRTIGDRSRSVKDIERKEREALCKKNKANVIRDKKKKRIPLMVGNIAERDYDEECETRSNFSCDENRALTGDNSPIMILDSLGKKKSVKSPFKLDSKENSANNSKTVSRRASFRNYEFENSEKTEDYIPLPLLDSDDLRDEIVIKKMVKKVPIKNKIFAKLS